MIHTGVRTGCELALGNVGKAFLDRQVLCGLELSISPGEFVAIVGRSGCGKSTLLRLLAGLEAPTEGTILLDGAPLSARSTPADTRLMFQDARLLPWKRVGENVATGLPKGSEAAETVAATLDMVGLADRSGDWPSVLSGGQRQRVALARALAASPRLLLLDEPLGALDALTRRGMQDLIVRLWQQHGFTAVLVTHDPEEAVALADRVLVLDRGTVTQDVRIDLPRPRSRGTAEFAEMSERLLEVVLHGLPATR